MLETASSCFKAIPPEHKTGVLLLGPKHVFVTVWLVRGMRINVEAMLPEFWAPVGTWNRGQLTLFNSLDHTQVRNRDGGILYYETKRFRELQLECREEQLRRAQAQEAVEMSRGDVQ